MKVHFFTLGCKTNQYETNAMEQKFIENGYEVTADIADIYIVNTCSVTNIAERKSRQMLRRAKELNPDSIIVACGCYAQVAKGDIEKISDVDIILGINEKNNIIEIIKEYIENKQEVNSVYNENVDLNNGKTQNKKEIRDISNNHRSINNSFEQVSDVMHKSEYEEFGMTTYTELNRAVVKIQDGCDRFCSYCIIPYARGMVRSREPEKILKEIEEIAAKGIKEVVLTGIHLASYGKDFKENAVKKYREQYGYTKEYTPFDQKDDLATGGFRLIELLEQINRIAAIERVRIGSLEPKLITENFVNRISNLEKLCHHFHLSLQSGCDETLKRMNRRYTTEEFKNSVQMLRNAFKDVSLTTDIIVGFPGETDEEFKKTYEFLKDIKFYKMHIFKYSPKRGTVAEKMQNQVKGEIKEIRSKELIQLSNKNEKSYNENYIGKEVEVLFEECKDGYYQGHTANYLFVKVKQNEISDIRSSIIFKGKANDFSEENLNGIHQEKPNCIDEIKPNEKAIEDKIVNQVLSVKIISVEGIELIGEIE